MRTGLLGYITGRLDTRLDRLYQLGLAAVASEIVDVGAAIVLDAVYDTIELE